MYTCVSAQLYPGRSRRRDAEDSDTLSEEEDEYGSTDSSSDGDPRPFPLGIPARPIFPFPALVELLLVSVHAICTCAHVHVANLKHVLRIR